MQKLAGKAAIITGGGQGVGLGIARTFAIAGAALVITGRDAAKLEVAAEALHALGAKAAISAGDVAKREAAAAAVATAVKTFGSVLVNQILQFGRFCARSRYGVPFSLYQ